jgi:Tol biopolymer transport system component
MKTSAIGIALAAILALASSPLGAQSGYDLFQKALATERADGNLRAAIHLYERVVKEYPRDRPLVARALVRIADCYEKLGQRDATKVYERVLKEFADQSESATVARARLTALQGPMLAATQSIKKLWAGDADPMGTPSLDGRYLSFTDWTTGDLAIRDLSDGTQRRITNTGGWEASGDFAEFSMLSPDGRTVVYAWFNDKGSDPKAMKCLCRYDLRMVSAAGADAGKPRVLIKGEDSGFWARPSAWMPDGKSLVIVRTLKPGHNELALLSLADGSVRVLRALGSNRPPDLASVTPDGKYLVYDATVSTTPYNRDIMLLSLADGRETPIVQGPAHDHSAIFTADGSQLLFLSDRTGTDILWRLPFANGKTTGTPVLVSAGVQNSALLGVTRSGAALFFTGGASSNVYHAELDDQLMARQAPALLVERFLNSNNSPALSPNGQSVAYLSRRAASQGSPALALVVHGMADGVDREVPVKIVPFDGLSWFPDSRSVLVSTRDLEARRLTFHRVDTTTGESQVLMTAEGMGMPTRRPQVSRDGRFIYYADRAEFSGSFARSLMRFDLASRQSIELKRVSTSEHYYSAISASPDGTQLAYAVVDGPQRLYIIEVMNADGTNARELYREKNTGPTRNGGLAWTPDGRYVLMVRALQDGAAMNNPTAIVKLPVAGGAPEPTGITMPGLIRFPSIHDSRRVAFAAAIGAEPAIYAIENFLPRD